MNRIARCLLLPVGVVLIGAGIAAAWLLTPRIQPSKEVSVARLAEAGDSGRVKFEVRNRTSKAIRLDSVVLLERFGTNWGFMGGSVKLGGTNCSAQPFRFEILPPGGGRDWKVKLNYGPQVSQPKLLWWRLKHAWETRNLAEAWDMKEGWDAERYTYSETFHP